MEDNAETTIPVTIDLGSSLHHLADMDSARAVEHDLAAALRTLIEHLGLAGEPVVEVRPADSERAVRLRVHGRLQPYSPDLMMRAWLVLELPDQGDLSEATPKPSESGFPDRWIEEYAADTIASADASRRELLFRYLARLALEIIQEQPGCLVAPGQAKAYLQAASARQPGTGPTITPEALAAMLRALLDLGVSIQDAPSILQTAQMHQTLSRTVDDSVESAFARLCSNQIEIHTHPEHFKTLATGAADSAPLNVYDQRIDEYIRTLFKYMADGLFVELGLLLPELLWIPSADIREGTIALKINERLGLPIRMLQPDELLVDAPVQALRSLDIRARQAINPSTGRSCAVVSTVYQNRLEQLGLMIWSPQEFIVLAVAGAIWRSAGRMITIADVEYHLAQLTLAFPQLVDAALARFSIEDITRILRGLLREGISIKDLKAILEQLLEYETIDADLSGYVVLDDRLTIAGGVPVEPADRWRYYLAFVRTGLKESLSFRYTHGQGVLDACLVDPNLEARASALMTKGSVADASSWLNEDEQELFRQAVWAGISGADADSKRPVILTTTGARAAIREIIAPELANLPVVARDELVPGVIVQPLSTISLKAG